MLSSAACFNGNARTGAAASMGNRASFAVAGEPFRSAEEAWLWTSAALTARHDGARVAAGRGRVQRPCEPDDVVRCLDRLYASRKMTLAHARILSNWGRRQQAPDPSRIEQQTDHRLWRDALALIEPSLRARGVVG